MTGANTFSFKLTRTEAEVVAGIAKAASTDKARPSLTGILVEVDDGVQFVATDSYLLARRTLAERDDREKQGQGSAIVPAKAFAKALVEFGKEYAKDWRATPVVSVTVTDKGGKVRCSVTSDRSESTTVIRCLDSQFPNYRQLFPPMALREHWEHRPRRPADDSDVDALEKYDQAVAEWREELDNLVYDEDGDKLLPALHPQNLKKLVDSTGGGASNDLPLRMVHVAKDRPIRFEQSSRELGLWEGMLMTVRT